MGDKIDGILMGLLIFGIYCLGAIPVAVIFVVFTEEPVTYIGYGINLLWFFASIPIAFHIWDWRARR
jgi:hypothetical protein